MTDDVKLKIEKVANAYNDFARAIEDNAPEDFMKNSALKTAAEASKYAIMAISPPGTDPYFIRRQALKEGYLILDLRDEAFTAEERDTLTTLGRSLFERNGLNPDEYINFEGDKNPNEDGVKK